MKLFEGRTAMVTGGGRNIGRPAVVGNLVSGSSAFSKTSLNIWKFTVHILLSLAWRILSITLLGCAAAAAKSLQSCPTL